MSEMEQGPGVEAHPRPKYILIFVALLVLTISEVAIAEFLASGARNSLLLIASAIKAWLVILYFMHLRHDSRVYWLIFFLPFILVVPLLLATLAGGGH